MICVVEERRKLLLLLCVAFGMCGQQGRLSEVGLKPGPVQYSVVRKKWILPCKGKVLWEVRKKK
ncbi:hypothetical protein [Oryza sativa Japonica Group]|uniref:Uncharacterized protein n=1 Tax=Oryza sativa subsp. japonica TaxID=39947 RepID=Q5QLW8_ORYSJ|nr:hypothetical protein [Oryza sativa Japonica Group]